MSIQDQNKKIARRWADNFLNTGDLSVAEELCAENYRLYFPGVDKPMDYEAAKGVLPAMRAGFPNLRFRIEDIVAEDDWVVCRLSMEGTHKGEFQGVAPTGKRVKMSCLVELRFRDGKIVEDRPFFDRMEMMEQLGVIPLHMKEPSFA
jgi:steroid delta-isomerase-like uncharacterized protein